MGKIWFLYVLECSDGSLYTGITNNLDKRIAAHNAGKGAKYTKGRGPVKLVHSFMRPSKSEAAKLEYEFKKSTRAEKISHIKHWSTNRTTLPEVINILKEQDWKTEWEADKPSGDNNSAYSIWTRDSDILYLGNYNIQSELFGSFPWADPYVRKDNILALLNGDLKTARLY